MKFGSLRFLKAIFGLVVLLSPELSWSQSVPTSCPSIVKRNNGNGQASLCAAVNGVPVAQNVVGTSYASVLTTNSIDPATKTGDINFKWAGTYINLPVITRVWIGTTASNTIVGPPPVPAYNNGYTYASYCFYVSNLPNQGLLTLEFTNPQTGAPYGLCTYNLSSNEPAATPAISCAPTITSQPVSLTQCNNISASFSVGATGVGTYQWEYYNGTTWASVSGSDFSGATGATLTVSNPTSYSGRQFRVVLSSASCGTTAISNTVVLKANIPPTAVFASSGYLCGTGARNLQVNLTGNSPWSLTYSATPGSSTTVSVPSSPYFLSVSPSATTVYQITALTDNTCANASPSGNTSLTVAANPTASLTNASACVGSTSFSLAYSGLTSGTDKYSITAGTRAVPGFAQVSNAAIAGSPISVTIPATGVPAGTYDFNLILTNTTAGCTGTVIPFTLTVYSNPVLTASASAGSVCSGSNVTLTAAPSTLSSYSWSATPSATISSVYNPTVSPTAATTYTVTGTDSHGCTGTANVSVSMLAGPTLAVTPSNPAICNGSSTILTASGGNTYSWSPSTGLSATSGASVVASPTATQTYTVTSTSATGCNAVGTVEVIVNTPSISISPSSPTICSGNSVGLTASGASTYSWTPSTGLSATTGANVTATPATTTTYYVTGTTAGGCTGTASSAVTVATAPVDAATSTSNNYTFCSTGTSSFSLPVNVTTSVTSMTWSYSTTQAGPYASFTSAVSPAGATLTPSSTGATNATLTISGYSNGGYAGPRFYRLVIVGTNCSYNYDIQLYDTKGSGASLPTPIASPSTICSGDATSLTIGTLNSGLTVQWTSSPDNIAAYTNVSGATSSTYNTPTLTSSIYYKAAISGTGSCGYTTAGTQVTVGSALSSNTVTPATTCTDGSTTVTLSGSNISGGIYQWRSSTTSAVAGFSDIIGATSQDYTVPGALVGATKWFHRTARAGSCAATTSTAAAVYAPIGNNQITTAASSSCASFGATTINAALPTGGSGNYVYSWESSTNGTSFTPIASSNTQNYTTTSQSQSTWYRRVVTSGGCSSTSPSVKFTVNANPTIAVSPATISICNGSGTTLTASGASSYSWNNTGSLNAATGYQVIASPASTTIYTVTGTDGNGCSNTATSTVTVNSLPTAPTLSASTTVQCNSSSYTLSSSVTSSPSGGVSYEWYTVSATTPASTYLINPATVSQSGTYYIYAKTASSGCFSTPVSLGVSLVNIATPSPLASTLSACSPATANLTRLEPDPVSNVTYEWHTTNVTPGVGNLVATPSSVSGGTYYLYGVTGSCYSSASTPVAVTINLQPTVSVSSTSLSACSPNKIDLTANIASPNAAYTYNWYNTNVTPGLANQISAPGSLGTSGTYYLYATSTNGCVSNASSAVTATVNTSPSLTITAPTVACAGSSRNISVSATSASSYQWQYLAPSGGSWTNITSGGVYSGYNTSTLTINPVTGLDAYQYKCIATGAGSCTTASDAVALSVEDNASVTSATGNLTLCSGIDTVFTATANVPAAEYQWKVSTNGGSSYSNLSDNSTYFGAQSPRLNITNISTALNGYVYECVVTNNCASATSSPATLTINQTPSAPLAGDIVYCQNSVATSLTASAGGGNSLLWYTVGSGGTGNASAPIPSTVSAGTTDYYVSQVSGSGCESSRDTLTVTVSNEYVWFGNTSNSWTVASNWECNEVPYSGANVRIIASPANQPQLQGDVIVSNFVFGASSYVELNSHKITVQGTTSGTPTFKSNTASSIAFTGAASTTFYFTAGAGDNNIKDLTVNNASANLVLGSSVMIVHGTVLPSAGTLNFNSNNVIIKSTATYAGRVAEITGTLSNAGNVTVERFVPAKPGRKWSSMASPVSQLLSNAWQQQIYITGPGTGGTPCTVYSTSQQPGQYTNGFDATQTNSSGFYYYNNASTPAWTSITGTNNTTLTPGKGYYVNVRGDRNVQGCQLLQYTNSQTGLTPTYDVTVKATGVLTQGDFGVAAPASGYHFLGNPYACEFDFGAFYANNSTKIQNKYWLYDPANITGNYMTWDGSIAAGAAAGYTNHNIIASGQGFFVNVNGAAPTILGFKENQKLTTYQKGAFKTTTVTDKIRINLFAAGDTLKQDDAVVVFDQDSMVNNAVTDADSRSMNGGAAWIATMKGTEKLAIQKRYSAFTNDTVNLYVYAAAAGGYSFSFTDFAAFTSANIFLLDNLTSTMQNVQQNANYSFSLANAGASANRFQLVFNANVTPLAADDVLLSAQYQGDRVHLHWTATANEERNNFVVQSSNDGVSFKGIYEAPVNNQGTSSASYNFIDTTRLTGRRFYRVKSLYQNNKTSYSKTVAVSSKEQQDLAFSIHPNPVKDEMTVTMLGQVVPDKLRIFTASGQVVFEIGKPVQGAEQRLNVAHLAKGVYFLELSTKAGIKSIQKFVK
jgi:hypothetical protein